MKSTRVRRDYSVKLPQELRGEIHPGDMLEVVVTQGNVIYVRPGGADRQKLRDLIARVRENPPENPPSEEDLEQFIHEVRRERK